MTTVTQAVAKRDSGPAELVRQSRAWFATIVPSHIDAAAFVALTVGHLRRNPKLADVAARNPQSFMSALSECARLGLVPGDTYHLVPFGDEITGIIDYTGEIELMYRAGAVASVKAEIVYSRDSFHFTTDMDRPEHAPNWFGDRGDLIGAYAYAVMKDGATSKVVIYSKAEIDRVKAVSKAKDKGPWVDWYDRMALKTVLHRLEHFVPTSAEYRREQLRAAAEIAQQVNQAPAPAVTGNGTHYPAPAAEEDITDAEIVEEPAPPQDAPATPPAARASKRETGELENLLAKFPWREPGDKTTLLDWACGGPYRATKHQCEVAVAAFTTALQGAGGDAEAALSALWEHYHAEHAQDAHEAGSDG